VHGTWFVVGADARGTTVEVLEGVVEVTGRDGDGSSTRLAAPQRALFPRGQGVGVGARSLTGREAAALRLANEIGLLSSWSGVGHALDLTGMLQVASTPPASLVVDGVPFGSTPLGLRRPHGRHLVELSRPGFATVSRWVNVGSEPDELHLALPRDAQLPSVTPPDEEEVRLVVSARKKHIAACYERSLKRDPNLAGTVELSIKIGPAGQVVGTSVSLNTVRDPDFARCLQREAAGWVFDHARNATVVYPFTFRTP